MFKLNGASAPKEEWVKIDTGHAGDFEILVRRPTYMQKTQDIIVPNSAAYRMETSVVGWRGVLDEDGNEIPFTEAAFKSLCEQSQTAFLHILVAVGKAFSGLSGNSEKN